MPLGSILSFILQRHSCNFKCDLSVQIHSVDCVHTHTQTQLSMNYLHQNKAGLSVLFMNNFGSEKERIKNRKRENLHSSFVCNYTQTAAQLR